MKRIEMCREIIRANKAGEVDGVLIDLRQAHLIVRMFEMFKGEESKKRFLSMDTEKWAELSWDMVPEED